MVQEIEKADYEYYVLVRGDGTHWPIIKINSDGPLKLLEYLGTDEMLNSSCVQETLKFLVESKISDSPYEQYIYRKAYHIVLKGSYAQIYLESATDESVIIRIDNLGDLLRGWLDFLNKYYNKEILGLCYPA